MAISLTAYDLRLSLTIDFLMSQLAIACNDVETAYHPSLKRPILNGIDCQIQQGEFVALLGLNGAGKSTLLRAFVGLIPLQRGKIHINGMAVTKRSLVQTRHHVGMLFQGGGLIRQLSAIDNVLCGRLGETIGLENAVGFSKARSQFGIGTAGSTGFAGSGLPKN
jgi:phosphonate transport system ATP-binding protein